jgi:hypothetical protein
MNEIMDIILCLFLLSVHLGIFCGVMKVKR